MARKLKVYRTPIGFHDAYIAAPSQKAALKAWGADADLFSRGMAETVTDEALIREPLAKPGIVVRRPRGSAAEHLAALSKTAPSAKRRPSPPENEGQGPRLRARRDPKSSPTRETGAERDTQPEAAQPMPMPKAAPRPKARPRPSRARLDEAERAIEDARAAHEEAVADIRQRQQALQDERRRIEERHEESIARLESAVEKARHRYRSAFDKWQTRSGGPDGT